MYMRYKNYCERLLFVVIICSISYAFLSYAITFRILPGLGGYAREVLIKNNHIKKALFSPDNRIKEVLIGLINEEQKSLAMAAFTLTDMDMAQALIDAHDRKVALEIVVDGGCMENEYSKVAKLAAAGIPVYSYPVKKEEVERDRWHSLMHNKFIIFGKSITQKAVLWTGSFNFTRSASTSNQENVLVLDDQELVAEYRKQFTLLKERSMLLNGTVKKSVPDQAGTTELWKWLCA